MTEIHKHRFKPPPHTDIFPRYFNIRHMIRIILRRDLRCPHNDLDTVRRLIFLRGKGRKTLRYVHIQEIMFFFDLIQFIIHRIFDRIFRIPHYIHAVRYAHTAVHHTG